MMKFENVNYHYDNFTGEKKEAGETIVLTTDAVGLDEVMEAFERFLRGCGFYFDGHLQIVENEADDDLTHSME